MVRNSVLRMISLIILLVPVLGLLAAIPPATAAPPTGGLQSIRQMPLLPDPAQPATGDLQEIRPLAGENSLDAASLSIAKAAPKGVLAAGESITYTVTVTNTGDATQTGVVITDTLLSPSTVTCDTLLQGNACVLTGSYSVTKADVDAGQIINIAIAASDQITTAVMVSRTTTLTQTASLTLDKPAPVGTLAAGETLTYTLTAENTGTLTQHAVTLSDPLLTPGTTACASLLPNATCVLVGTYMVTQADIDAGTLTNTASVTSTEVTAPVTATQTVSFTQSASLTLDKPAPAGTLAAGEMLTYTLTAENTGTLTQHAVTLSDPLLTPDTTACASLLPSATCVLTGTYLVTQADVDAGILTNTASVTSTEVSTPVTATQTVTFTQYASLTLDKPAPAGTLAAGETLSDSLTAANTGTRTRHA
ncbi:MAG: hypothetical protein RBT75_17420, partial [Anaerolineae bacterium]|nr:hypothetical protein [Anaerolineae bacterium]